MDAKLKDQAEKVFGEIGIDSPTAIRIFFKKVVSTGGIPFSLNKSNITVNGFSPEFEDEILRSIKEDKTFGPYKSAAEAIKALHKLSKNADNL